MHTAFQSLFLTGDGSRKLTTYYSQAKERFEGCDRGQALKDGRHISTTSLRKVAKTGCHNHGVFTEIESLNKTLP